MSIKSIIGIVAVAAVFVGVFSACTKKGSFIDEQATGSGMHYYPVIITDNLVDTITHKYLNLTDTTFTPSQQLIFELDFYSQDPVDSFELWAGRLPAKLAKVSALGISAAGYSPDKRADTVLFHYTLPSDLDSADWYIVPRVVTTAQMEAYFQSVIRVR